MRFGHAELWWLFAAPLLGVVLAIYATMMRRGLIGRFGHLPLVRKLVEAVSPERRALKHLLVVLALALLALAAVRPQFGRRPEPLRQSGIDVAVAFDISKSMLARDVQPSRLDAARGLLDRLLTALKGDRVALVPFAGVAFTQSPLTADASAVRLYLASLDPRQMPIGGTNIAMAINQCLELLTGAEDKAEHTGRTRVILLITDGEDVGNDQGEAAREAARKAHEAGVQIYAVGVGTRVGEPIPLYTEEGEHAGYQKDSQGKPIYSKLNLTLLEELAQAANPAKAAGSTPDKRVFHFDGTALIEEELGTALGKLQKSTLEEAIRHTYGEKFQYALFAALLLLLADLGVGERRAR